MTGYKILSEDEFKKIKDLQGYGLKNKAVAEILGNGRTTSTISRVKNFDTLEEYRAAQVKKVSKPVELKTDGAVKPRQPQLFAEPSEQTLSELTAALIRLAIAVENMPSKRKLF